MWHTFNIPRRREVSILTLAALALVLVLGLLAGQGCKGEKQQPLPEKEDVGDLEVQAFAFTHNDDGETVDLDLNFFDNLDNPDLIEIGVQVNSGDAQMLTLTCRTVAGQQNTCTGGTGTCSGNCPDRTYDEFPGKTFSGECAKPRIGLKVCTCTNYRVNNNRLGLRLPLAPSDTVTLTLDPNDAYLEAAEDNNTLTMIFSEAMPSQETP